MEIVDRGVPSSGVGQVRLDGSHPLPFSRIAPEPVEPFLDPIVYMPVSLTRVPCRLGRHARQMT